MQVVDCKQALHVFVERKVPIYIPKVCRAKPGLPVVEIYDIGLEIHPPEHFHCGLGKKREAFIIVAETVIGFAGKIKIVFD
jgi:hypothetical protein